MKQCATLFLVVVWCNLLCKCMVCRSWWVDTKVEIIVGSRLVVVINNVATISWAIELLVQPVDLVTIAKIVRPFAVVEMLEGARFLLVAFKMHEHS